MFSGKQLINKHAHWITITESRGGVILYLVWFMFHDRCLLMEHRFEDLNLINRRWSRKN